MMKQVCHAALGLAMMVIAARSADGQILSRPTRRAPAPSGAEARPWQTLTFNLNTLAGWDQDVAAAVGSVNPNQASTSGTSAFGDASLRYQRGRRDQLFEVAGRGFANTFGDIGRPGYGADGLARFDTPIGRRHRLEASESVRTDPMYVVGGFSVLRAELAPGSSPDTNSLNAFDVRRSYFSGSSVSAASQWSSRASTVVSYRFDVRRFGQTLGDATTHSVGVGYRHRTTRRSVLRLDYGLGDARYEALGRSVPATSHNGSAGFELDHPISATRRLAVSVGAGASIVRTTSLSSAALEEFVTPTGFTSVRYDWARSWSVSADYRRAISNLEGISAESFKTDAALARVGGFVHRNAEVTATAGFSNGSSGLTISGFRTWTVASQLRLRLRRRLWTVVTHSYYRYSLQSIGTALASAPPNFDRQSIRVGLSLDWPVYRSRNARPRQDFE